MSRSTHCNFSNITRYYSLSYSLLYTLWKNEKFTLTEIFFRQINSLVIYLVNALLSRNFCQKSVRVNLRNFHTVTLWKNEKFTLTKIFFRQINSLVIYFVNVLVSRNFFQKTVRVNFHNFHTVYSQERNMHSVEIS